MCNDRTNKCTFEKIQDMITATELKTKGVKIIEERLSPEGEVAITVRGKVKYVIFTMRRFQHLKACEEKVANFKALKR